MPGTYHGGAAKALHASRAGTCLANVAIDDRGSSIEEEWAGGFAPGRRRRRAAVAAAALADFTLGEYRMSASSVPLSGVRGPTVN